MLVSEFVKEYKNTKQKDRLIEKHISNTYIPYMTKVSLARRIVETCSYKEVNGVKMFVLNSPMRYMLFVRCIIEQYTDLEFDKISETDLFDLSKDLDLLEEYQITEGIINAIGVDINSFTQIINLVLEDEIDNNRSIVPFLETKIQSSNMVFDAIEKVLKSQKLQDEINSLVNEE